MKYREGQNIVEERLYALKRYFMVTYEADFQPERNVQKDNSHIRNLFDDEENNELIRVRGK
ncbi:hypothetical protein [Oceanobacillus neutriphilus]|uniref:Uncharacterized protein n=1 Tax=Oceanobacillus neutriphilus TaxID=531815 RepID=A0ABQ2P358_9BACI|nr:hypothetical protein [Oceanobacillus neutriphilus]GGP16966.1 hypothetical protein GCM10011346_51040 [Oceanobacillus neutriphilus]